VSGGGRGRSGFSHRALRIGTVQSLGKTDKEAKKGRRFPTPTMSAGGAEKPKKKKKSRH